MLNMAEALRIFRLVRKRIVDSDLTAGLEILERVSRVLTPGYRFSWNQLDWWLNEDFNQYLAKFGEQRGFNSNRRWMLYQLGGLTIDVPGDTAECGAYAGAGSYLMCLLNRGSSKVHHVFDSFAGLSQPGPADGSHWREGDLAVGQNTVEDALREFARVRYHKGWIPERFPSVSEAKFSFVHVDVDLERPTRDSIEFFYPRLSEGAILLCDDYGFTTCPGATKTIDEFLSDKPEKMLRLDGGGGFFMKGRRSIGGFRLGPQSST
jgi:hypothetical protein